MDRLERGLLLHSSLQPSGFSDLGSQKVTTPPLLAKEVEGEVGEEGRWGTPIVRTKSRESRRSLQDWAQAAEERMLCGWCQAEW